ncbi:MAG: hypothetical protein R3A51_03400 [Nannocystaceae bacterium]
METCGALGEQRSKEFKSAYDDLVDVGIIDVGLVDGGLVDGGRIDGGLIDGGRIDVINHTVESGACDRLRVLVCGGAQHPPASLEAAPARPPHTSPRARLGRRSAEGAGHGGGALPFIAIMRARRRSK